MICSTAAPHPVLTRERFRQAVPGERRNLGATPSVRVQESACRPAGAFRGSRSAQGSGRRVKRVKKKIDKMSSTLCR